MGTSGNYPGNKGQSNGDRWKEEKKKSNNLVLTSSKNLDNINLLYIILIKGKQWFILATAQSLSTTPLSAEMFILPYRSAPASD
jgi:hypothetical protein